MITVAGALVGIALAWLAGQREAWLRAAILAQAADLVTFAATWEHARGELNPIGVLVNDAANLVFGEYSGAGVAITAIVMFGLKLALIAFLVRISPALGRYRRSVMAVATAAGVLGACSNVIAHPNATGSLLVVGLFAVIAARWPDRFGDSLGAAARFSATVLLAIGGLAVVSYLQWLAEGYGCDSAGCPRLLVPALMALALAFFAAALITLWLTVRFSARFLHRRAVHAD